MDDYDWENENGTTTSTNGTTTSTSSGSHLPASIGGSIVIFLLLVISCVVVVAVVAGLVRRRRRRRGIFEIPEMNNNEKYALGDGVTNAMYDCKLIARYHFFTNSTPFLLFIR